MRVGINVDSAVGEEHGGGCEDALHSERPDAIEHVGCDGEEEDGRDFIGETPATEQRRLRVVQEEKLVDAQPHRHAYPQQRQHHRHGCSKHQACQQQVQKRSIVVLKLEVRDLQRLPHQHRVLFLPGRQKLEFGAQAVKERRQAVRQEAHQQQVHGQLEAVVQVPLRRVVLILQQGQQVLLEGGSLDAGDEDADEGGAEEAGLQLSGGRGTERAMSTLTTAQLISRCITTSSDSSTRSRSRSHPRTRSTTSRITARAITSTSPIATWIAIRNWYSEQTDSQPSSLSPARQRLSSWVWLRGGGPLGRAGWQQRGRAAARRSAMAMRAATTARLTSTSSRTCGRNESFQEALWFSQWISQGWQFWRVSCSFFPPTSSSSGIIGAQQPSYTLSFSRMCCRDSWLSNFTKQRRTTSSDSLSYCRSCSSCSLSSAIRVSFWAILLAACSRAPASAAARSSSLLLVWSSTICLAQQSTFLRSTTFSSSCTTPNPPKNAISRPSSRPSSPTSITAAPSLLSCSSLQILRELSTVNFFQCSQKISKTAIFMVKIVTLTVLAVSCSGAEERCAPMVVLANAEVTPQALGAQAVTFRALQTIGMRLRSERTPSKIMSLRRNWKQRQTLGPKTEKLSKGVQKCRPWPPCRPFLSSASSANASKFPYTNSLARPSVTFPWASCLMVVSSRLWEMSCAILAPRLRGCALALPFSSILLLSDREVAVGSATLSLFFGFAGAGEVRKVAELVRYSRSKTISPSGALLGAAAVGGSLGAAVGAPQLSCDPQLRQLAGSALGFAGEERAVERAVAPEALRVELETRWAADAAA